MAGRGFDVANEGAGRSPIGLTPAGRSLQERLGLKFPLHDGANSCRPRPTIGRRAQNPRRDRHDIRFACCILSEG